MFKSTIFILFLIDSSLQYKILNDTDNDKLRLITNKKSRIIVKRDNCVSDAASQISQNAILSGVELLKSFKNPSNLGSLFASISGLTGSIFGFNSDSTCDIHNQLSKLYDKIIKISSDIFDMKFDIEGQDIKRFYTDLSSKIKRFLNLFKQHTIASYKDDVRNQFKKQCEDINSGISKIYDDFLFIMENEKAIEFLKNRAKYKQKEINKGKQQVLTMCFDISFIIRGCEEALVKSSNIDLINFYLVTKANLDYFNLYINRNIPQKLLRESIFNIANAGNNASETAKKLKDEYSNFIWTVIFYSDKLIGFDNHCAYTSYTSTYGSFHFIRELKNRNALIAWTIPFNESSKNYFEPITSPSEYADKVAKQFIDARKAEHNFVLSLRPSYWAHLDYSCWTPCYLQMHDIFRWTSHSIYSFVQVGVVQEYNLNISSYQTHALMFYSGKLCNCPCQVNF